MFLKKVTLQQLPKYISSLAKKKKVSISKLAIDLLTDFVGSDLALIDQELEKISLFISPRTKLEIEDLEKHLIRWKEDSVFDIVEFIGTGRIGQAAAILNNLFMANPSDRSFSIKFLGLLSRHFRLLWMLIDLKGKISSSQMASRMKVQPFVVDKLSRQAGNFSPRIFPEIFALLLNTDKNLKSSGLGDEIIMADLLFKLGQL